MHVKRGLLVLFLASIVLAATGTGYAFPMPTGSVSATAAMNVVDGHGASVEANVQADVNGPARVKMPPVARRLAHPAMVRAEINAGRMNSKVLGIIRKHFGDKRFRELNRSGMLERILSEVRAHREHVLQMVRARPAIVKRWESIARMYQNAVMQLRHRMTLFQEKRSRWEHYHQLYVRGEIDENTYFQVSKDFVLSAIDTTIARLEAMSGVAEVNVDVNSTISQLKSLREQVAATTDLNELRGLYSQKVLPELRSVNQSLFSRMYMLATIRATDSIAARLDVAAARLTEYKQLAEKTGVADENFDAKVDAIFVEISNVRSELNALQADVTAGKVTDIHVYLQRIRQIKEDLMQVYRDIHTLMKEYAPEVRATTRVRGNAGHNVRGSAGGSVEANTTSVEANVNVTAEVNA